MVEGKKRLLRKLLGAEVVGSNPTSFIFIDLDNYDIKSKLF
jgi:hypothetical protein